MVERVDRLDVVFAALSDPIRRDILRRVGKKSMSIGEIAQNYTISFAGVAKHVDMLTRSGLVTKTRHGKEQFVALNPAPLGVASHYLEQYRNMWEQRLDALGRYLKDQAKGQ